MGIPVIKCMSIKGDSGSGVVLPSLEHKWFLAEGTQFDPGHPMKS